LQETFLDQQLIAFLFRVPLGNHLSSWAWNLVDLLQRTFFVDIWIRGYRCRPLCIVYEFNIHWHL